MSLRELLVRVTTALLLVSAVALVAGSMLGQPVLLSYVTSESMEPTLHVGDGFVAIPAAVTGPVERGDVVTFRAKEIQGGGLTTHRVIEETDRGYVTKGDNNPFVDQDRAEPPVKDSQIVAVAWQPGGSVLAIPNVGRFVTATQDVLSGLQRQLASLLGTGALLGTQGLAYLLLALAVLAYVADIVLTRNSKQQYRDTTRDSGTSVRLVVAIFAGAVVLAATAAMAVPAGPQEFETISAERDSPGPRVIEAGTNESVTYAVGNGGLVPVVTYHEPETDGVDFQPREMVIPGRSSVNATLTLSAPPETGYYRQYIVEHRYLLVLPQSTIRGLHNVHPWLPVVVIGALLGTPLYVLGVTLAGTGRIRPRSRDRDLGIFTGFRRALRDRY